MESFIQLVNHMSPFILLGFLLAGLLHAFLPTSWYQQYLSRPSFKSILYATLLAIPLPLCSCGVIPTAMSLRKEGATKGATNSFLIATPQTGVDSILATYSLLGLPFAILRPLAALVTALCGGFYTHLYCDRKENLQPQTKASYDKGEMTCMQKLKEAFRYAFIEMMEDIGKWLIIGLVLAGLITLYVPDSFFQQFNQHPIVGMLGTLLMAIPMYLCATGSIPIAVALLMKGLSPGAAFVMLMAGPATNIASVLVIQKVMGTKSLVIYLSSIFIGAFAFGCLIDYVFPTEWFTLQISTLQTQGKGNSDLLHTICSIILLTLLAIAMLHRYRTIWGKWLGLKFNTCQDSCECAMHETTTPLHSFVIEGMHCNHCREQAQKTLLSVPGVENVEIDLATGQAQVVGDVNKETLSTALTQIGFEMRE